MVNGFTKYNGKWVQNNQLAKVKATDGKVFAKLPNDLIIYIIRMAQQTSIIEENKNNFNQVVKSINKVRYSKRWNYYFRGRQATY